MDGVGNAAPAALELTKDSFRGSHRRLPLCRGRFLSPLVRSLDRVLAAAAGLDMDAVRKEAAAQKNAGKAASQLALLGRVPGAVAAAPGCAVRGPTG